MSSFARILIPSGYEVFSNPLLLGAGFLKAASTAEPGTLFGRPDRLASFNQKSNASWEFAASSETVANWMTLFTIVDRPDARTRPDLYPSAQKRFELNFVKTALGPKNAYMAIYGVRVADPTDYVARRRLS
jgi:hypothetical protein